MVAALVATGASNAQLGNSPWPKHRRDLRNSGCAATVTSATPAVKWAVSASGGGTPAGPVIGTNGDIYLGATGNVYCFGADGTPKWTSGNGPSSGWGGLAVGQDGTIYTSPRYDNHKVYALRPTDGGVKWSSPALDNGNDASPTVGPTGTVYVQTESSIYGLNPASGAVKWQVGPSGWVYGSPVVTTDASGKPLIIAGYTSGGAGQPDLICVRDDGSSAALVWNIATAYHWNQPALSADGLTVYVACFGDYRPTIPDNFFAINARTGAVKWSIYTGGSHYSGPTVGPDGTIYVASHYSTTPQGNGKVFALRDNGTSGYVKWVIGNGSTEEAAGTPAVTASGVIYSGGYDSRMTAIKDNGATASVLWTVDAGSAATTGAIDTDGTLYFPTSSGLLIALAPQGSPIHPASIGIAKRDYPTGKVSLLSKCVTTDPGGGVPTGSFYAEENDRSAGLRVIWGGAAPKQDQLVHVTGQMGTVGGEQAITATTVVVVGNGEVDPLIVNNRDLGMPLNRGLLVKVAGKVTAVGADYYLINDGSSDPASNSVKVVVGTDPKPAIGIFLTRLAGISAYTDRPTLLRRKSNEPPPGYMEFAEQDILVAIYTNTNGGTIAESDIPLIMAAADDAKMFYERNTFFKYNQNLSQLVIRTYRAIVEPNGYIYPSNVEPDLHANGIVDEQYDGVMVVAPGSGAFGWGAWQILGSGGYCQNGWFGREAMPWYFVHEYGHVIDSQFNSTGFPDYPHNHPGVNRELIGVCGPDWDVNADINRRWTKWMQLATNPNSHWGRYALAVDADGDGLPDNDSRFVLDEARFGSSDTNPDTDADGLSDLQEVCAGILHSSDPNDPDTDNDGVLDGADRFPLYPLSAWIPASGVTINSPLSARTLLGTYFQSNPSYPVSLYANWMPTYLHLAIKAPATSPRPTRIYLYTDNNSDGIFHGTDNYKLTLNTSTQTLEKQEMFDAVNVAYPGDFAVFTMTEAIQTRFVVDGTQTTVFLAIPKNTTYGLDLPMTGGEEIGLWLVFDNWGQMFEWDVYFRPTTH